MPAVNNPTESSQVRGLATGCGSSNLAILITVLAVGVASLACSGASGPPLAATQSDTFGSPQYRMVPTPLNVVTTVSAITGIVESIGGVRIILRGVVPEGVNSHAFEPAPSLAATLAEADLIFLKGLFLEEPTLKMAQANHKVGASMVTLGDQTITRDEWKFDSSFAEADGHPHPRRWPNPILALRYAQIVRDTLEARDPDDAECYQANYDDFASRIAALDAAIKTAVPTIPERSRKLLTYHDSGAYFADRYGLTVIGAVPPSDFSEPSAGESAYLIRQIRTENIPAAFGSEVFPSGVMRTIAAESGAAYIDELSGDDLPGGPGGADRIYLGLAVSNLKIMIPALDGEASALDVVDVSPFFDGSSDPFYPQ